MYPADCSTITLSSANGFEAARKPASPADLAGLADLADPAAAGIPVWLIRGEEATGGLVPSGAIPAFAARIALLRTLA